MQTLGIDLAAADDRTAACVVDWSGSPARVVSIETNVSDARLVDLIGGADKAGIDVPLGWPDEFVEFVVAHQRGNPLPPWERSALRLRETDRFVHHKTRRWPLSVAADRIAVPAMRAARLLAMLADRGEPVDRTGEGRVVEVYPAAALTVWGFTASGYKRDKGREARCTLLGRLVAAMREWLDLPSEVHGSCEDSDDVLDALVAALVARAAALKRCEPIPDEDRERARREGWIACPLPGSLQHLPIGSADLPAFHSQPQAATEAAVVTDASKPARQHRRTKGETTVPGYGNRNRQTVVRATDLPGNDHMQRIYVLRCGACEHQYGANGSDIHLRRCPACQGGAPGLKY